MPVVVVATIHPQPQFKAEVIAAYTEGIPAVHAEPGCQLYALHDAGDTLIMIEQWATQADLDAHAQGTAKQPVRARLAGKLAGPSSILTMQPIPAGTDALGLIR